MDKYVIYFFVAFLINFVSTPIFARLSLALGIIDHPSQRRFHLTSMPMLGGVSLGTVFLGVIIFAHSQGFEFLARPYLGLFIAAALMMCAGLLDDIKGISPVMKLLVQVMGAGIIIFGGIMLEATGIYAVDIVLTVIWIVGIINCLNLVDNIDGLSSGTAAIGACFFALFALLVNQPAVAMIAIIFSGVCMGFLFHNFHPASLFLGDAGSMFVGTMLAGLALLVARPFPQEIVYILAIGVVLGILIFDTGLVVIMRKTHGLKITDGGRDHTSHRLCSMGLSVQASVTTLFAACFFFGACAIAMIKLHQQGLRSQAILIPTILFLIASTCWFLLKDSYNYNKESV